jgi:DNA-binding response OmpR family regulator
VGGSRRRVLIAEDHNDLREMFCVFVAQAGHDIVEAEDGPSAIQAGLETPPDAAFIDIGLPDLSGWEVARQLRDAHGKRLLLVALSGHGEESGPGSGADSPFDLYLVKPVSPEGLRDALRRLDEPR